MSTFQCTSYFIRSSPQSRIKGCAAKREPGGLGSDVEIVGQMSIARAESWRFWNATPRLATRTRWELVRRTLFQLPIDLSPVGTRQRKLYSLPRRPNWQRHAVSANVPCNSRVHSHWEIAWINEPEESIPSRVSLKVWVGNRARSKTVSVRLGGNLL